MALTLQDFKTHFPGLIFTFTLDKQRIWHYFREESDLVHYIQDNILDDEFSACDDLGELLDFLKEIVDGDLMLVDIDNLSTKEWKALQEWEAWPYPGDLAFWQSMTSGLSLDQRLQALNLSREDALEIFAVSPSQLDTWQQQGLPTHTVEQFSLFDAKIDMMLGKWGDYCRDSVDCSDVVGIPGYEKASDYHACDKTTSQMFQFLALYNTFCQRLLAHLKNLAIRAVIVNITYQELKKWLSKNRYPLIPGSRILYATQKIP